MKLGIIGLSSSGKTTLFNCLSKARADEAGNFSSSKKPNIKVVPVPDKRLDKLSEIFHPKKTTPAYIEFVDIAGLAKSDGAGKGAGNQFLPNIREVDALVHVVRCFAYEGEARTDPIKDIEVIDIELIVSDLESIEKRIQSIEKQIRNVNPKLKVEKEILKKIKDGMENDIPARNIDLSLEELKTIKSMGLLTLKPIIYCANIADKDVGKEESSLHLVKTIQDYADKERSEVITICAKIEEEISQLDPEDKKAFMQELLIKESALDKLVRSSYKILGLISFLTAGPDEVRAWTIRRGQRAPIAAGKIHSDIERGFIRAETIDYNTFMEVGSFIRAREKGLLRSEGKQYIVQDGDIIDFKFNV
jgi:ribosome-binding ATPase